MPRIARSNYHTTLYHIIQKSPVQLFRNVKDRKAFIEILKEAKALFQFNCYGFSCCLDDKFELIIHVKYQSISKIMQSILISYAKYYQNQTTLFPRRYQSIPLYSPKEVSLALENINEELGEQSLCHFIGMKDDSYKVIDFFSNETTELDFEVRKASFEEVISSYIETNGCDESKIHSDISLRNACIKKLYQDTGCTLKEIAKKFELSPSMVSKILKDKA